MAVVAAGGAAVRASGAASAAGAAAAAPGAPGASGAAATGGVTVVAVDAAGGDSSQKAPPSPASSAPASRGASRPNVLVLREATANAALAAPLAVLACASTFRRTSASFVMPRSKVVKATARPTGRCLRTWSRPRWIQLFTVPTGRDVAWAISVGVMPCTRCSVITSRCGTGRPAIASCRPAASSLAATAAVGSSAVKPSATSTPVRSRCS